VPIEGWSALLKTATFVLLMYPMVPRDWDTTKTKCTGAKVKGLFLIIIVVTVKAK